MRKENILSGRGRKHGKREKKKYKRENVRKN
jgi:hypothetical protein